MANQATEPKIPPIAVSGDVRARPIAGGLSLVDASRLLRARLSQKGAKSETL
jgi:hypothetical protein